MKVGEIETKDISIVVQGPIIRNFDYYSNGWTNECLKRLRQHFPDAEIILSTWKGSDVSGLDYDILVENDDPGAFLISSPLDEIKVYYNLNRQIHSTKQGLKCASRKYAMKVRSDTIFATNNILSFFGRYPNRCNDLRIFKERVITGYIAAHPHRMRLPFFISDFLHLGLREDITLLWDIPLAPEPETSQWFLNHQKPTLSWLIWSPSILFRYAPEQYIWFNLIKKYSDVKFENLYDYDKIKGRLTDLLLANNIVLLDLDMLGVEHLRFPGNKLTGRLSPVKIPFLKKHLSYFTHHYLHNYRHRDWFILYQKYCCQKFVLPHIWYDILFPAFLSIYHFSQVLYRRLKYTQS